MQRWKHERTSTLRNSALAPLFCHIIILGARALRSRGSSVGMVSRLRCGFRSSTGARGSLFPETTRLALGPTQSPVPQAPGVNRPGPEADKLFPLVPGLRMSGAQTTLPLWAVISGTGAAYVLLYFTRATIYSLLYTLSPFVTLLSRRAQYGR